MAPACAIEVATLLPSPTNATVRPARSPKPLLQRQNVGERLTRVFLVGQRVDDGHPAPRPRRRCAGCPVRTCGSRRRPPSVRGCARRPRPTRALRARRPRLGSTTSPPSSRTAIVNVSRVRREGFSNSSATCFPASGRLPGWPSVRSRLSAAASSSTRSSSSRTEVEDREQSAWPRWPERSWIPPGCLRVRSCSILRVDANVLRREIARPHRGVMRSARAEIDRDDHPVAAEHGSGLLAPLVERHAVARTAARRRSTPRRDRARTQRPIGRRRR